MRYKFSLIFIIGAALIANAQFEPSSRAEYDRNYNRAFNKTYKAFPTVLTRTVEFFKEGKRIETYVEVHEIQAFGVERLTMTSTKDGISTHKYNISTGIEKVYCSEDGVVWTGPQKQGCYLRPWSLGLWSREGTGYSVSAKKVNGEDVKVYKEYVVYAPTTERGKRHFAETLVTVDSRGFLKSVVAEEGSLDPREVLIVRKETFKTNSNFEPVTAPVK